MAEVEARVGRARNRLDRAVHRALRPLEIQEDIGISQVKGDILVVTGDPSLQEKLETTLQAGRYRHDMADNVNRALGYLKLGAYRLVIVDCTERVRSRLFDAIHDDLRHIKVISVVSNEEQGRTMMRRGNYSYLLTRNFDPEQLRTCLTSALQMRYRVCQLLVHGERCNRSCVSNQWPQDGGLENSPVV